MFLSLAACIPAAAQSVRYTISPKNAETVLHAENIRATVDYLAGPSLGGRASGTEGAKKAAVWLEDRFMDLHLEPFSGAWMHGFRGAGFFGRNIIGLIPGTASPARYVVVMAHFDNLGTLGGNTYPGADSNASGVAALLEIARMFFHMKECKKTYGTSLIVAALDGKEKDLAGAADLWRLIEQGKLKDPVSGQAISPEQILMAVNLDQLVTGLAPITKGNPNYIMMLSDASTGRRSTLESVNRDLRINLELGYDYYGSKDFTQLFYRRVSDQRVFLEHGIPSVMFTSGITLNNNKVTDTPQTLDYTLMRKRIQLIFYWLDKIL